MISKQSKIFLADNIREGISKLENAMTYSCYVEHPKVEPLLGWSIET